MNNLIGQQIKQYRIAALLGQGGMGAVYHAYDLQSKRQVALKVVHQHLSSQNEFQQRFLREIEVVARLEHPAIVHVYDSGSANGLLYLAMEFVPGGTLDAYLKRLEQKNQLNKPGRAMLLAAQIANALDYAHRQGVIHGDVKPGNILLRLVEPPARRGELPIQAVLTDFGLATLLEDTEDTAANVFIGSLAYMSPEQCLARKRDGRSDLYSLGILLYRLATGRLPFDIKLPTDAVLKHTSEIPPSPRQLRPELSEASDAIIMKALAKQPADRFQTGQEMAQALRQAAKVMPATAVPPPFISPSLTTHKLVIPQPAAQAIEQPPPAEVTQYPDEDPDVTRLQSNDCNDVPNQMEVTGGWPESEDRLIIGRRGQAPTTRALNKDILTIGRDAGNDIVLDAVGVSRRHVRLEQTTTGWQVADLDSSNGTFLDGNRLLPDVLEVWQAHQTLCVGPFFLQWRAARQRASRAALLGRSDPGLQTNGDPPEIHSTEQISLLVTPTEVSVVPGNQVEQTVALFNQGVTVDHFKVRVEGLPATWVTVPADPLQLLPGERGTLLINIHPPHESKTTAGPHPYQIVINSTLTDRQMIIVASSVTVAPFGGFSTDMQPKSLQGRGTCRVLIINEGNFDATYTVIGRDPGEAIRFVDPRREVELNGHNRHQTMLPPQARKLAWQFLGQLPFLRQYRGLSSQASRLAGTLQPSAAGSGPPPKSNLGIVHTRVKIAAGEQGMVELEVEPKQRPLLGRMLTLPFEVQISEPASEPQALAGQLEVSPVVPPWLPPVLGVLLLLLCLSGAALTAYVSRQKDEAVATAVAVVTATAAANQADDDGDGLTNAQEEAIGTDPNVADTDGDGTPDGEEAAAGTTPDTPVEGVPTILPPLPSPPTTTTGIANGQPVFTNTNSLNVEFAPCGLDQNQLATIVATSPGSYQIVGGPCPYLLPVPPATATPQPTLPPTATPTPTITPAANTPPVAAADNYSTLEDTPLSNPPSVLNNDVDPDSPTLTAVLDGGPEGGTLSLNANGTFIYTPAPNFSGTDSFSYHATDGINSSNVVTVLINVTAVNDPPAAVSDRYNVNEDTTLNSAPLSVLDNDSDVDSGLLTATRVGGPENGSLSFNANGTFVYTPNANFSGSDTFTYYAGDGAANSAVTTVIITVGGINDAPVAVNDSYSIDEDTALNSAPLSILDNDRDVDNVSLTAVADSLPSNGSLQLNTDGTFVYVPNANFFGVDTFTYHASDGVANSATAAVTINVRPVNDPPVIDLNGDDEEGTDFAVVFTASNALPLVDTDITLIDVDNATNIVSATVLLSGGLYFNSTEELAANTEGTSISVDYDDQTGRLHLQGSDSAAHYQQVLGTVIYNIGEPSDDAPEERTVEFVVYDGSDLSNTAVTVISICGYYCSPLSNAPTTSQLWITAGLLNLGFLGGLILVVDWPVYLKRFRKHE